MADPFVAEIRIFPFNFAPTGWAFCNGQILPISQNTALFALLGTTYGGNGQSTFALPNLQGSVPTFWGQGPGLSNRFQGETGGSESVTLIETEMPAHAHSMLAATDIGDQNVPTNRVLTISNNGPAYAPGGSPQVSMSPQALSPSGGSLPHNNLMPYLTLNFCIALQGIFPPRG
ncbi:phage tail protein [Acidobacteria bacterium ACD]|nr:MAG: phage tail protein [Acidobacteriota bacterium]MCE7958614.1 phage tail protein [Acidobacteria bacterium ACB2]MDL1949618.1 phage tail protein [Acidobacteria bacterium ACD]